MLPAENILLPELSTPYANTAGWTSSTAEWRDAPYSKFSEESLSRREGSSAW